MENENQQSLGQTKKCPKCGEEIQSSAKKCKHCQSDLRNWLVRHKIITSILILVAIVIIASVGVDDNGDVDKAIDSELSEQQDKEKQYNIGDIIRTDRFEITIVSAKERKGVGDGFFESTPSEGGVYMTVQWKYKNISDEPIGSFSTPTLKLVDGNGTTYSSDIGASGNFATELELDRKILSDLNPGLLVNDAEVFEISKEQLEKGEWKFLIKADKDNYIISFK